MGFYANCIFPRLMHTACGQVPIRVLRERMIPLARGRVLEVGVGSGLNLPYYDAGHVTEFWALDPSPAMLRIATDAARASPVAPHWIERPVEDVSLESASMDTVVMTFSLCSIAAPEEGLAQVHRVLRPEGRLIFCEHGAAPDQAVRRWQNRLTPLWRRLAGGCHLNRDVAGLLTRSGFRLATLETTVIRRWWLAGFLFHGIAVKPA
ncbi:MAG: class I SAM-dependent methyltransferase [Desulfovibrionales bacterium]|nr:MAG: class I SAM-dependent methyltransferase [Desulfovibrionales bacterium]